MAIEHACVRVVQKPWGNTDLLPWSEVQHDGAAIGELWFQRANMNAPDPALLLKLLFTKEPLSIQVHPDDAFAQSIGLGNGKTEAWYILSAAPDAKVAVGLTRQLTAAELRCAIDDGSIAGLVQWRAVGKDDIVYVPAGTIHAIGPGLVLAEIQQRSDATFRLFDHGRVRELHVDNAVAAAFAGPAAESQPAAKRLTDARTLLVASPYFVLERIDFAPKSNWDIAAGQETWLLVLEGHAQVGPMNAFVGEAIFLEAETTSIQVGGDGLRALLAYAGADPVAGLLHNRDGQNVGFPVPGQPPIAPFQPAKAGPPAAKTEMRP
ncbi:class I mannose-6-phosphate isomerase [Phreatobacter stygius]|uniref:Mannose-6-phosphate isomerase n=1 Tax=Phreatobacter stygius TaxID=1940610 RepID=A0A4D7BHZ0_9HYPH|nr:class I mannose-6-phosphate isomerase [Phreatobacter stygius]QCI67427.1 mannose-6-phosphate isomerase [Phreatobacter stygius]